MRRDQSHTLRDARANQVLRPSHPPHSVYHQHPHKEGSAILSCCLTPPSHVRPNIGRPKANSPTDRDRRSFGPRTMPLMEVRSWRLCTASPWKDLELEFITLIQNYREVGKFGVYEHQREADVSWREGRGKCFKKEGNTYVHKVRELVIRGQTDAASIWISHWP